LNQTNKIPSFSLGEYYDYTKDGYEEDTNDSNVFDNCDCLRINPLLVNSEKCMKSLDQDSFNEGKKKKRSLNMDSRESWNNNWRLSSILATLDSFKMDSVLVRIF
jgi:hypothetical protein